MKEVLYRKHRPSTFEEVKGQDRIVQYLKRTIETKDIPHAYLFVGSRGTGKTSVARIFAREIGCDAFDIFEIDAASHTGVDDIRDLNGKINTLPFKSPYKVYILDEVHMLSKAAFNAFLKTLEEPPKHVIFILATTEEDSVPDTVKSRCQVCVFQRPSAQVLQDTLEDVAKKEGRDIDTQTFQLIALMADGSFRDALTLLQSVCTSSKDKKVSVEEAEQILGASSQLCVISFVEAVCDADVNKGKRVISEIVESGFDISLFNRRVVQCMREALLTRWGAQPNAVEGIENIVNHKSLSLELLRETLEAVLQPAYIKELPLEMLLISQTKNKKEERGTIEFNYTDNNGCYDIGNGIDTFTIEVTECGDDSLYLRDSPANIRNIGLIEREVADLASIDFDEIKEVNMSSEYRTIQLDNVGVLRNDKDRFAVLKLKKATRDSPHIAEIEYRIMGTITQ